MKEIKSISMRTLITMICTLLVNGISFISSLIFARLLPTFDYGYFSVFLSWVNIFTLILGAQTYGTFNNAKIEYEEKKYQEYCFNAFAISTVMATLLGILFGIFSSYLTKILSVPQKCVIWIVICAYGMYMVSFMSKYLIVERKVIQNLVFSLVITSSVLVSSLVLTVFFEGERYYGRILGYSMVYLFAAIGVALFFCRTKNRTIKKEYCVFCLRLSLPLVVHGLAGVLLAQGDRIMLMNYSGESIVGVYSFCYTLSMPISVIANAINSAFSPDYFRLKVQNEDDEIENHYRRQIFVMTCVSCGYLLIIPEIIKGVSTQDYWGGIAFIPAIVVAYYFNFLYFIPVNHEFYHKNTKYIALSTFLATATNLFLNFVMIPIWGMNGAAIATLIAYILLFLMHDIVARCIIKQYKISWKVYIRGIIPMGVCWATTYILGSNYILRWMSAALIGILLCINVIKKKVLF